MFGFAFPVYSAPSCNFQAKGLTLAFGFLNPSIGTNVSVSATATTLNANNWGGCSNQTMSMSADNGLHFFGTRRMSNGTAFISYSLTLPANATGPTANGFVSFILTGTVLGTSYIDAPAGSYSDSVQITVTP